MCHRFVLASKSPRRQELLAALGVPFGVVTASVDESPLPGELPWNLVTRLSCAKALAATEHLSHEPGIGFPPFSRSFLVAVLAADTVVALDEVSLGKPADATEAATMLRALRGRTHQVYTAVTLAYQGRKDTRLAVSEVTMRDYSDDEVIAYVSTGDPLDKAGAYAIQDRWFAPAAKWSGCFSSIMGLPLGAVTDLLTEAGLMSAIDVAPICDRWAGRCCRRNNSGKGI
jgi:septum formation protein